MKNFRKIGIAAVLFAAVCIGAGCGAKKDNSQEVFRQYGINCLNEGKYEDAVTAFQKALDQSVGGITEVELDTCYYKAEALYKSGDTEGALEVYNASKLRFTVSLDRGGDIPYLFYDSKSVFL